MGTDDLMDKRSHKLRIYLQYTLHMEWNFLCSRYSNLYLLIQAGNRNYLEYRRELHSNLEWSCLVSSQLRHCLQYDGEYDCLQLQMCCRIYMGWSEL